MPEVVSWDTQQATKVSNATKLPPLAKSASEPMELALALSERRVAAAAAKLDGEQERRDMLIANARKRAGQLKAEAEVQRTIEHKLQTTTLSNARTILTNGHTKSLTTLVSPRRARQLWSAR